MSETLHPVWLRWPETLQLVDAFTAAGATLRFVGGAVRGAVLDLPVDDVDAATPLEPQQVMGLLIRAGIKALPTGIAHGTVTAVIDQRSFEITTLRRDVETDGRHAEVQYTDDWREDAKRRDFTLNALYLSPEGELFDYFDGVADARAGHIRFIGDAATRIEEDYLRILRFFRFYAHYGKGAADAQALAACQELAARMKSLSGERIRHETFKLLTAYRAPETLILMLDEHVLPHVLGFGVRDCSMFLRLRQVEEDVGIVIEPFLKLAVFILHADIVPEIAFAMLCERFRLPRHVEKTLRTVLTYPQTIQPKLPEAAQKRAIRQLGALHYTYALLLNWAYGDEPVTPESPYHAMLGLAARWQPPVFPVSGDDLIARGIKPGERMGEILRKLEEKWEDSHYRLSKEKLLAGIR